MDPLDFFAESTMLGGTLRRTADGRYLWSDGSEWHGVFAPVTIDAHNFRIAGGCVEVPRRAAEANAELGWCLSHPTRQGYRGGTIYCVPLAEWDRRRHIPIGVEWAKEHERDVLDKAMELGWDWPGRSQRSIDASCGTVERTAAEHASS